MGRVPDDLRTLLLYGGPITEPVGTLKRQGWEDFELLSTERALADAAGLREAAGRVHLVPDRPGRRGLRGARRRGRRRPAGRPRRGPGDRLGEGGRRGHGARRWRRSRRRSPARRSRASTGCRPAASRRCPGSSGRALVLAYAEAMTSAPEPQLRATAMNALAHGADSLYTPLADPISRETALAGRRADRRRARPGTRGARPRRARARRAALRLSPSTEPGSRSITCSARPRCGSRDPARRDLRRAAAADDGGDARRARRSRSRRWRRRWAPSPTGSRSGSPISPAQRRIGELGADAAGSTRWSSVAMARPGARPHDARRGRARRTWQAILEAAW